MQILTSVLPFKSHDQTNGILIPDQFLKKIYLISLKRMEIVQAVIRKIIITAWESRNEIDC